MAVGIRDRIVLLALGLVVLGGGGLFASLLISNATVSGIVSHLAEVLLTIGIIEVVYHWWAMDHIIESVTASFERQLKLPVKEFHETRHTVPSLRDNFREAREIWFAWHTGSAQTTTGDLAELKANGRPIRLLLTHPKSQTLVDIAKISGATVAKLQEDIHHMSRLALRDGVEARWWPGSVGASMNIANPGSADAWALVETPLYGGEAWDRPLFVVSRVKGRKAYEHVERSFLTMWGEAQAAQPAPAEGAARTIHLKGGASGGLDDPVPPA